MIHQRSISITAIRVRTARALTLIELLVVLVILTILATVAIRSTEGVFTQSRYESTVRALRNLDLAIVGDAELRQSDGTPIISGFLSDVGRLPQNIITQIPGQNLAELWNDELWTGYPYQVRSPANHPSIRVACGWRGPYVKTSMGSNSIVDGWGRPFVLVEPDPEDNEPFDLRIISSGADGSIETADQFDTTDPYSFNLVQDYTAGVPVSVSFARRTTNGDLDYIETNADLGSGNKRLTVMLFVPDPQATNGVLVRSQLFTGADVIFENVPPGRRAFRAYIVYIT